MESVRNVLEWLKKAGYLAGETAEEKRAYTSNRDLPGSRGTRKTDYVRQMNRS